MLIHYYVSNKAKYLNANSHYIFTMLPKHLRKKTIIIPNFFSNKLLDIKLEKKENYIITVSHGFKGHKNIGKAILAYSLIRKNYPDFEYYLVGSELGEREDAYNFAKRYGVQNDIRFLGQQSYDKTLGLISKAKLMLHPSLEESFGMSVLEAMVLGTPVVGGQNSGNIPHLLGFGEYGGICDIKSPNEISKKVCEMLKDENIMISTSKNARKFAVDNFSESKVIEKFENYYESILNDKSFV